MERLTYFLLGLSYTSRIKWWATLFDPLGSCCTRLFKNEMSQDDARLVGWLLWLAKHTFTVTRGLLELKKIFRWKILCTKERDPNKGKFAQIFFKISMHSYMVILERFFILFLSWDIMVFCQNFFLRQFIGQENLLKLFQCFKDTAETFCPCPFPTCTTIFVIPTTLSQNRKLTHDKTLLVLDFVPKYVFLGAEGLP